MLLLFRADIHHLQKSKVFYYPGKIQVMDFPEAVTLNQKNKVP